MAYSYKKAFIAELGKKAHAALMMLNDLQVYDSGQRWRIISKFKVSVSSSQEMPT